MATISAVVVVTSLVGCTQIQETEPEIRQVIDDGSVIAPTLGTDAAVIWGGFSTLVNAVLGVNQILLGRRESRLGKIVRAINDAPNSPPVLGQLADALGPVTKQDQLLLTKVLEKS